jgi:hypothetical protein
MGLKGRWFGVHTSSILHPICCGNKGASSASDVGRYVTIIKQPDVITTLLVFIPRSLSLSLFPVAPTLEQHRASVKRFVSLQFHNPKTVARTAWMGDQPVARPLPIQTQNKHRQTSMPWVGFEPTIPVFERAKTVHALDRAATVTG